MLSSINLLPSALPEMFAQVTATQKLTLADRYGMLAVLLDDRADAEDLYMIDRIFYALRQGIVQVVDEISVIG
jgi:hypothetical protein